MSKTFPSPYNFNRVGFFKYEIFTIKIWESILNFHKNIFLFNIWKEILLARSSKCPHIFQKTANEMFNACVVFRF